MSYAKAIAWNGFTLKGWRAIVDSNGGYTKFSDIYTSVSDIMARIEKLTTGNGLPDNSSPKTWIRLDKEFERLKKEFAKSKKWSSMFKTQKKVIAAYSEPLWQRHDVLQDWMHGGATGIEGDDYDRNIKGALHPENQPPAGQADRGRGKRGGDPARTGGFSQPATA